MNYTVQITLCPHHIRIFSGNALLAIQTAFPGNTNTYVAELETPMRNTDIYLLSGVGRSFIFVTKYKISAGCFFPSVGYTLKT
jgi:hypothetical protein